MPLAAVQPGTSNGVSNLIIVIGPRRSGLHAVCNWLIGHFPGRVRFVNDPPIALPPDLANFLGCYDYDVSPDGIKLRATLHLLQEQARLLNWNVAAGLPWPWDRIAARVLRRFWDRRLWQAKSIPPELDGPDDLSPDTHLVLFENLTPVEAGQTLPAWVGAYRRRFELPPVAGETVFLVLRSPWNYLASSLQGGITNRSKTWESQVIGRILGRPPLRDQASAAPRREMLARPLRLDDLWIAYAKEFLGESRYLARFDWHVQPLLFDEWIAKRELRATIAGKLGRPLDDRGLSRVSSFGGGSSFGGAAAASKDPQELNQRWRQFHLHPAMQELLASPEITRLSGALGLTIPARE